MGRGGLAAEMPGPGKARLGGAKNRDNGYAQEVGQMHGSGIVGEEEAEALQLLDELR